MPFFVPSILGREISLEDVPLVLILRTLAKQVLARLQWFAALAVNVLGWDKFTVVLADVAMPDSALSDVPEKFAFPV